jgi:signal transduction histidine kinase
LNQCDDAVAIGDRHRLRQVLLNLTDNAIKYNHPGGTVTMALRNAGEDMEIEVVNTGEGIPPDLQSRIFDRFVRGDEARNKAIDGCGLGLAIVRWIVETHCGTIRITSDPGKITKALVRLPRMKSKAREHPQAHSASDFISHGI